MNEKVILISIDGMRASFSDQGRAPSIPRSISEGTGARAMGGKDNERQ